MSSTTRRTLRATTHSVTALALALAFGATPSPAREAGDARTGAEAAEVAPVSLGQATADAEDIVYVPPRRGSPRAKVGGGVRGTQSLPAPLALAPAHVALTTQAAPSLFWHLDGEAPQDSRVLLVFTLIDESGIEPVAEVTFEPPKQSGIQRIRLEDLGISLEPDAEYEWSISLVADPERRAQDLISTGHVMRVSEPRIEGSAAKAADYARLGLWYDALESLSDAIEASPDDASLRAQRDALLEQAELEAAASD